jgi:hypothetical protein
MAELTRKPTPGIEGVMWDGSNTAEVFDLARRVAALGVWAPLDETLTVTVNDDGVLHPGLNIVRADGVIVARVEKGNYLIFDPFAETPLFAMIPEHVAAFYGDG